MFLMCMFTSENEQVSQKKRQLAVKQHSVYEIVKCSSSTSRHMRRKDIGLMSVRRYDVALTSVRRYGVTSTSVQRHFHVMCPLG